MAACKVGTLVLEVDRGTSERMTLALGNNFWRNDFKKEPRARVGLRD
jgi:hypothetical protein